LQAQALHLDLEISSVLKPGANQRLHFFPVLVIARSIISPVIRSGSDGADGPRACADEVGDQYAGALVLAMIVDRWQIALAGRMPTVGRLRLGGSGVVEATPS